MNPQRKTAVGFGLLLTILSAGFNSCAKMKIFDRPFPADESEGLFHSLSDGTKIFVHNYLPKDEVSATIFILSGITGISHNSEKDIIEALSGGNNRVVVIHPRGTGYSEGKRGDISNFSDFINDYIEIIKSDPDYQSNQHKIVLFGHSMSTAILLAVADQLENIGGAVLVNPPYVLKKAKGMSPGIGQYAKYALYMVFAKHKPVVNMAGNSSLIENVEDRRESEQRMNDPLLVKYFSMYMMLESKKTIDSMIDYAKKADYPLLLIYGAKDNIVEKIGCDLVFDAWFNKEKKYVIIENGTHGKSTVILAKNNINDWIDERKNE